MIMRFLIAFIAVITTSQPVIAQMASYAMFDFEDTGDGIELVVAIQPERAVGIAGGTGEYPTMLQEIRDKIELLAAYVESHVSISQGGADCAWQATPDPIGETLLDAQAEGITFRGRVGCPAEHQPFTLETDLFTDAPGHVNEVRYAKDGSYVGFARLDRENQRVDVDLRETFEQTYRESEGAQRTSFIADIVIGAIILTLIVSLVLFVRKKIRRK